MNLDTLISLGYYLSSLGFLIATYITWDAARAAKASSLKTVLQYLFIGTATFFAITVFQKLAELGFYNMAEGSSDVWWHLMFYTAMISLYFGFKTLAGMASADGGNAAASAAFAKTWGIISAVILAVIFVIPSMADSFIQIYTASRLSELGAHHFVAFALAGVVGAYIFSAKLFLGQVGRAIAAPMIIAIWALALQHMWELLNESWKVIVVTPEQGEGGEKIFLIIAAACIIAAALRIKKLATA